MTLSAADREELHQLVIRYASAVDRREFETIGSLFTSAGVLVAPQGERRGRDQIVAAMRGLTRYRATFHLVGQSRVWEEGPAVAGETYCVAHHFRHGSGAPGDHVMFIRYLDTFAHDGEWRFARRELDVVEG